MKWLAGTVPQDRNCDGIGTYVPGLGENACWLERHRAAIGATCFAGMPSSRAISAVVVNADPCESNQSGRSRGLIPSRRVSVSVMYSG
jgi:hypothetical protein